MYKLPWYYCMQVIWSYMLVDRTSVGSPYPPPRGAEKYHSENKDQLSDSEKVVDCSNLSVDPLEGAAAY